MLCPIFLVVKVIVENVVTCFFGGTRLVFYFVSKIHRISDIHLRKVLWGLKLLKVIGNDTIR